MSNGNCVVCRQIGILNGTDEGSQRISAFEECKPGRVEVPTGSSKQPTLLLR